jgi:hypothetical protein
MNHRTAVPTAEGPARLFGRSLHFRCRYLNRFTIVPLMCLAAVITDVEAQSRQQRTDRHRPIRPRSDYLYRTPSALPRRTDSSRPEDTLRARKFRAWTESLFSGDTGMADPSLLRPEVLPEAAMPGGEYKGYIAADLPNKVDVGDTFDLDLILVRGSRAMAPGETVTVFLEQTDRIRYEPRVLTLTSDKPKTVRAHVKEAPSGLTEIIAHAGQNDWAPLYFTLNVGFAGQLRPNLPPTVESGRVHSLTVDVVDRDGRPLSLDAPVQVRLEVTEAEVRLASGGEWNHALQIELARGATSTPLIQVRARSWSPSSGQFRAEARINDDAVIGTSASPFAVTPVWWVSLLMSMLGGLLYSAYRSFKTLTDSRGMNLSVSTGATAALVISSTVAGALAFLLADWELLGIKPATTSLRGFLVLGFLFAYVGVDALLRALVPQRDHGETPGPPKQAPS